MFICPKICHCIFRAIRIVLMAEFFIVNKVFTFYLYYKTYWILEENWWVSDDEPFMKNESWGNATLSWFIWIILYPYLCLILYCYLPMCIFLCCVLTAAGQMNMLCS